MKKGEAKGKKRTGALRMASLPPRKTANRFGSVACGTSETNRVLCLMHDPPQPKRTPDAGYHVSSISQQRAMGDRRGEAQEKGRARQKGGQ